MVVEVGIAEKSASASGLLQPVHTQMYDKRFISDGIAVRPTAARRRYRGCVAMRCRLAAALTTYQ